MATRAGHRVQVVREFATLQRALSGHRDDLVGTGLCVLDPEDAPQRFRARVEDLAALPARHPFALGADGAAAARTRIPLLERAAAVLADSGVPLSVEHNDLHDNNAFLAARDGAPLRFFDFGDALWAHPFVSLFVPMGQVSPEGIPLTRGISRRAAPSSRATSTCGTTWLHGRTCAALLVQPWSSATSIAWSRGGAWRRGPRSSSSNRSVGWLSSPCSTGSPSGSPAGGSAGGSGGRTDPLAGVVEGYCSPAG